MKAMASHSYHAWLPWSWWLQLTCNISRIQESIISNKTLGGCMYNEVSNHSNIQTMLIPRLINFSCTFLLSHKAHMLHKRTKKFKFYFLFWWSKIKEMVTRIKKLNKYFTPAQKESIIRRCEMQNPGWKALSSRIGAFWSQNNSKESMQIGGKSGKMVLTREYWLKCQCSSLWERIICSGEGRLK